MRASVFLFILAWSGICSSLVQNVTIAVAIKGIYWVDTSCKHRTNQNGYQIWDVIMAGKSVFTSYVKESLTAEPMLDTDFARVFEVLFNVPINSHKKFERSDNFQARFKRSGSKTPKKMVLDIFTSLNDDWQETLDRPSSHLRIYCDNGRRFQATKKRKMIDNDNGVMGTSMCGDASQPSGSGGGGGGKNNPYAFLYNKVTEGKQWKGENPDRAVMTICDSAFARDRVLSDFTPHADSQAFTDPEGSEQLVTVDFFRVFLSYLILHEWTHSYPYFLRDVKQKDSKGGKIPLSAYKWGNCVAKSAKDALINADNYALLGIMAWLGRQGRPEAQFGLTGGKSGGFTLQRKSPKADKATRKQIEADAKLGRIHFYHDITTPGNPLSPLGS